MSDRDSDSAGADAGFRQLLDYFSLVRQQPLKPVPHPDREVNELIRGLEDSLRRASVLIPVTRHSADQESQVVLTVRSENLRNHAGQISFPGGSSEPGDADTAATALRETEEEIGINAKEVEVLGKLGDMALPSGFLVTPIVGLIEPGLAFTPCPEEVADVFQVPLSLILDPSAYRASTWEYQARNRRVLELYYEDYRIWGVTAAMLFHLASEVSTASTLDSL
ncbi:MAG: CoA pyrophosphatase [Pseudohongiellaceae bacterium]